MAVLPLGTAERLRRLAARHRLANASRTDDVAAITASLGALHSSDPTTVYLTAFARMDTPCVDGVSAALYTDRSIVRHHGMRRTVWVYTPEVARFAHGACTVSIARKEWEQLAGWAERSGIDDGKAWIAEISEQTLAALRRLGPLSARQLGKAVPELTRKITIGTGKYTGEASAHTRILQNLGFDASIVRTTPTGTWQSSEYSWTAMTDWIPEGITGCDAALARDGLARSYLAAFGPVTIDDIRWWAGWTAATAKAAVTSLQAVEVGLDDGTIGWVLPHDVGPSPPAQPWAALLPSLDPTAMGWKERAWYLGEHTTFGGPLFDRNGNVGPTVWFDGRVVGGWSQNQHGSVVYELLEAVGAGGRRLIDQEVNRLQTALDGARVTPRFPTPLQKQLSAR